MIRFLFLALLLYTVQVKASPEITAWYGDSQKIAHGGSLLDWCLHGSVANPANVAQLTARLNNGNAVNLTFSSSSTRLMQKGTFIAEFPVSEFITGTNTITLTALDKQGQSSEKLLWSQKMPPAFPGPCLLTGARYPTSRMSVMWGMENRASLNRAFEPSNPAMIAS